MYTTYLTEFLMNLGRSLQVRYDAQDSNNETLPHEQPPNYQTHHLL